MKKLLLAALFAAALFGENLSIELYKKLESVQKLMEKRDLVKAEKALADLEKASKKDIDRAYIYQMQGNIALWKNENKIALSHFKKSADLQVLPQKSQEGIDLVTANLLYSFSRYKEGIEYAKRYYKTAKDPKEEFFTLIASSYIELREYREGIKYLERAREKFNPPSESIYQMLFGSYYYGKNYKKAKEVLEETILHYNKLEHYLSLSSVNSILDNEVEAESVIELAYKRPFEFTEDDVLLLINRLLALEIYYKSAKILEEEIETGVVKKSSENYRLLADIYIQAKEIERAKTLLEDLVKKFKDEEILLKLAHIYYREDKFQKIVDLYGTKEIEKGASFMILAVANFRVGSVKTARTYLLKAKKFKEYKKSADEWLESIK